MFQEHKEQKKTRNNYINRLYNYSLGIVYGIPSLDILNMIIRKTQCLLVCGAMIKNLPANPGDIGSIPGLGRSCGEGKGSPFQYCGLENSMGYIVTKSWTSLSLRAVSNVPTGRRPNTVGRGNWTVLGEGCCPARVMEKAFVITVVVQSRPTLCDPMDGSAPGFPVRHHLLEFAQTHVR